MQITVTNKDLKYKNNKTKLTNHVKTNVIKNEMSL